MVSFFEAAQKCNGPLGRLDASEPHGEAERMFTSPELQPAAELLGAAKMLGHDLTVDTGDADGVAHIIRDDLHNVYKGIGFDAAYDLAP
jgi:hypothetical protein